MPIYNKKILFIHIPKTGGTYIENKLKKYDEYNLFGYSNDFQSYLQHFTYIQYIEILKTQINVYNKFTIIRNPYDRLYSAYKQKFNNTSDPYLINMMKSYDFKDFVLNKLENLLINRHNNSYRGNITHILPQIEFIKDCNNIKIILYEKMNELTDYIARFDINEQFEYNNNNNTYIQQYDNDMVLKVNTLYNEDIELYNKYLNKMD
jgi:hypothetical protein